MILPVLVKELIFDEGIECIPYYCSEGFLTIGIGRNLKTNGLTKEERKYLNYSETGYRNLILSKEQALYLLNNDINSSISSLKKIFFDYNTFSHELQHVLINLMHQLGYKKFLGFKDMIAAINKRDFKEAAVELRDSKLWKIDTPEDAERLAVRFEKLAA